ncbi:MAG TPA: endonuclease NucS [Methanothrix sp.]|mgnify:CR=1 FL=1|nr:endonuclease NucS [Methanothrix sp.]HPJ83946.1 endonuclease NucS [Methanothrix sp.]HPR67545.1 endonuclease NucS [Methanothrix sp.]
MAEDIRVWEILEGDKLAEIKKTRLDLETRLEKWLEQDISILSSDLLVIGRQVDTDFGGFIDLLCLDYNGDVVIVELKRDKTPREVTAQALDYASWVADLSNEKITEIANGYLGEDGPLEDRFRIKFGTELPEIINEHHSMIIVASEIDDRSERIIRYLSENYGVGINAATFQYFHNGGGKELLSRVFLIDPIQVEYSTRTKTTSKRPPPLSYDDLQKMSKENGVGDIYDLLVERLAIIFNRKNTTRSSIAFVGVMSGSQNTIFSLIPKDSNPEDGLKFQVYINRLSRYLEVNKESLVEILPQDKREWGFVGYSSPDWTGYEGFFKNIEEAERFSAALSKMKWTRGS